MTIAASREGARALVAGHLVAFPTETVFGLGADAGNPAAVERIFSAKGRPSNHPLIVHVSTADRLDALTRDLPPFALTLARAFWPGPMTLIAHRSAAVPDQVTGGQDTVGVRVPNHPVALELLAAAERLGVLGVAAPSANRFGRVSPTTAAAVRAELGDVLAASDVILDGEPSAVGIESTIIDCTGSAPAILRPGAVTAAMIEQVTGMPVTAPQTAIRVSGSLASHYAPRAAVVLDVDAQPGDGLIALADRPTPPGVVRLAAPTTDEQYAHELYGALRAADERGLTRVVALLPQGQGIAEAIRDRLQRSAHPDRAHP
ncbi:L-threonylcarbamoyladenylate synthase [Microcella sp.]|uniref:L-threonylcarbamoyladenylate synthase n=1 Tax=Microcella sp. TaxID=1913979 RepID=UPI00391A2EE9